MPVTRLVFEKLTPQLERIFAAGMRDLVEEALVNEARMGVADGASPKNG